MKGMNFKSALTLAVALFAGQAFAAPVVVNDAYVGSDDHGYGDVIGDANLFGINSASLNLVGNTLTVTINTNFAKSTGGLGSFGAYTSNYGSGNNPGISYGDLFLADTWTPFVNGSTSTVANGYKGDNKNTGTNWDYGFSMDAASRKTTTTGTGTWYDLQGDTQNSAILASESFLTGAIYRNGQAIAVNRAAAGAAALAGNNTSFSINQSLGTITFSMNLAGTALETASTIGFRWSMTCGNDAIEGSITRSAPEPTQLGLFGLGLAALGLLRKRKAK